jgi:DNA gyrase subunit A
VRGIALAEGDEVISMSLVDAGKGITTEERDGYLRQSRALRQADNASENAEDEAAATGEEAAPATTLSPERFKELQDKQEFVLTVASSGLASALGLRVPGPGRVAGRRADESRLGRSRRSRRAAFPVLRATRSCWSPTAAR